MSLKECDRTVERNHRKRQRKRTESRLRCPIRQPFGRGGHCRLPIISRVRFPCSKKVRKAMMANCHLFFQLRELQLLVFFPKTMLDRQFLPTGPRTPKLRT